MARGRTNRQKVIDGVPWPVRVKAFRSAARAAGWDEGWIADTLAEGVEAVAVAERRLCVDGRAHARARQQLEREGPPRREAWPDTLARLKITAAERQWDDRRVAAMLARGHVAVREMLDDL